MANKKQEFYMQIKAILDKQAVKKDAEELQELLSKTPVSFDTPEFEEKVREVVKKMSKETMTMIMDGFNDSLGLLKIDVAKMLEMPNENVWREMGKVAAQGFSGAFNQATQSIDEGQFKEILETINRISDRVNAIAAKGASGAIKSIKEVDEALGRQKDSLADIESALQIPEKATKANVKKYYEEYNKSIKDKSPWEVQYKWLVKFMSAYDSYTSKSKKATVDTEWTDLYTKRLGANADRRNMLQNILNRSKGMATVGYTKEPWAQEATLQEIKNILAGGLKVHAEISDTADTSSVSPKESLPMDALGSSIKDMANDLLNIEEASKKLISQLFDYEVVQERVSKIISDATSVDADISAENNQVSLYKELQKYQAIDAALDGREFNVNANVIYEILDLYYELYKSSKSLSEVDTKKIDISKTMGELIGIFNIKDVFDLDKIQDIDDSGILTSKLSIINSKNKQQVLGELAQVYLNAVVPGAAGVDTQDITAQLASLRDALTSNETEFTELNRIVKALNEQADLLVQKFGNITGVTFDANTTNGEPTKTQPTITASVEVDLGSLQKTLEAIEYKVKIVGEDGDSSAMTQKIVELTSALKTNEEFGFFNSTTGATSKFISGTPDGVAWNGKLSTIDENYKNYDTTVHNHPEIDVITASAADLNVFIQHFDNFRKHIILGQNEILQFDFSKITKEQLAEMSNEYKAKLSEIVNKFSILTPDGIVDTNKTSKLSREYGNLDNAKAASILEKQQALMSIFSKYGDTVKIFDTNKLNTMLSRMGSEKYASVGESVTSTVDINAESLKQALEEIAVKLKEIVSPTDDNASKPVTINDTLSTVSPAGANQIAQEETLKQILQAVQKTDGENNTPLEPESKPLKENNTDLSYIQQWNDAKEKTIALLKKELLSYEDILYLVKIYNDESLRKAANVAGDSETSMDVFSSQIDIAGKLVPTHMMGIGSDSPDQWLHMVGLSAEDAAEKLHELYQRMHAVADIDDDVKIYRDDEAYDIERENGALEDKLELLNEIAARYQSDITQRHRNRHEELNQKDMDDGLTNREQEIFSELEDKITEADEAIAEFGETYDKIILKLGNGKQKIITPSDQGLRMMNTFYDKGYGQDYDGIEIEDIIFERVQKETIVRENNIDVMREEIRVQQALNETKQQSLLPIADNFKYTRQPSDAQKAEVLKLGEEYRVIMSLLEKDNEEVSEISGALRERANAIMEVMHAIKGNDGLAWQTYRDDYGGSAETVQSLADWAQRDKFYISSVDSNKIDNTERQAAIDLIYKELEAEKQLAAVKVATKEAERQQKVDNFVSRYENATMEEKKLVNELTELWIESHRLLKSEAEEDDRLYDEVIETRSIKAKQLKQLNFELYDAFTDAGLKAVKQNIKPIDDSNTFELAPNQEQTDVDNGVTPEIKDMTALVQAVEAVTEAVGLKTQTFREEKTAVDEVVTGEIESLQKLEDKISVIKGQFETLVNNIRGGSDDIGAGLSNVNINVNYPENTQTTLDQEALNKLADLIKQAQTKTPETAIDAAGKALATESTLSAIKTAVESINDKTIKGTKVGSGRKSTTKDDYQGSPFFGEKLKTREMELAKFVQQLMNKGQDTPKMQDAVKHLKDALKLVNSGERLSVWDQKFRQARLAVGIDDLKEQPDNKESIQTYKNLIAYAKEYYSLVEKYEKAKDDTDRKATLGRQKQDAETFMRENGLDLDSLELGDEAYNKRLSDLREKHRKNLEVIKSDNQDKVNAQNAKETSIAQKEEADIVKKLIALYKELGNAKARQNTDLFDEDQIAKAYVDEARIRKEIKAQRNNLGVIDKNTGLQFKQAKAEAYATTITDAKLIADSKARKQKAKDVANANAKAAATEKEEVDELSKAYEKLGKLVAARNYATTKEARDAIQETINKRVKEINSNSRNNFANRDVLTSAFRKSKEETEDTLRQRRAEQEGKQREQAEANARKTLTDLSKELGVLEAKSKFASTVPGKDEYDRQIQEKKAEIALKKEGVKVDEEELEIARQLAEQKQYNTLALQNSEKIGKADLDTQQKENNQAYERLIKLKETQYNIEKKLLAAEAGSEKESAYKSQLADVETLIEAQRELLYYEDKIYEQKLLDKDAAHQRDIEELIAGQVDADNKKKKKEQADDIKTKTKEAMTLAKTIGELDAKLDFVDDNDDDTINEYIRQISEKTHDLQQLKEELKLDDDSVDTAIRNAYKNKYDSLAPTNSQTKYRKTQSEELREEKQTVKELNDLYKQLGQAEARRDMTAENTGAMIVADDDAERIEEQIEQKRKLININKQLEKQFADSWASGIEKETKKPIQDLGKEYEKLGELRAQVKTTPDGDYLTFLKKQLATQEKLVEVESRRLEINAALKYSYEQKAEDAYTQKLSDISGQKAKERDKKRNADADKLLRQQLQQSKERAKVTKAKSAIDKADNVLASASSIVGLSNEQIAQLTKYSAQLKDLKDKYDEIRYSKGVVSPEQQEDLINQTANVSKLTKEIGELLDEYNRLSGDNATELKTFAFDDKASIEEYRKQLTAAVMERTNGKAHITGFNAETKELTYTIKNGKYEITEFTAAARHMDDQIVALQGSTKRLETPMEKLGRKMSEILTYFGGSSLIYEFFGQFRQGIQYVRDIDSALTELKKVTDETEESYDRFLNTAAKTADKVGSTITNIVSSTADWSRLGFSMEDAAQLAESTSVLLNVSEFSSIEDATSALTSTMQAFGYVAEDSMHVVDVLNEVGNNFAISSDGIATALQDSASALMAANNSYEEAVALIAAANRVVQDPNSVGAALRTISLRLRGTSVKDLEEAGEDTTGAITSKSKLRSQIKNLSGVDILTDAGAYKSTYQILLEISHVWEKMNDMDQAALLEILAGRFYQYVWKHAYRTHLNPVIPKALLLQCG